ncbi:pilus assembly protein PilP [Cricetibacter osteomyelitidis]|uniref:Pilus assembly protein PilP n=1 Tax=Cricetibacter osteomyelitidis TaxID=1521931 RepID=A0A4R2TRM8_9PAST|nr:pilus assembly protein PilP [Cricetibacter osteomyelitidis]TCP97692.1 pilus assembly protein PilP [Cricetibacter osteomyelitidis]
MNYRIIFIFLMVISHISTAKDPFNQSQRTQMNSNNMTEEQIITPSCQPVHSVIAENHSIKKLQIRGVILQKNKRSILFEADSHIFFAGESDFIATEKLQILSIGKKEIRLADWQHSPNCTNPNIKVIKF